MNRKILSVALLAMTAAASATAQDFFSTEKCDDLFTLGVRLGFNTSNRTIRDGAYPSAYHHESWGLGFDVGATASLNIRDYLAIQPGFFFETRSGAYSLMGSLAGSGLGDYECAFAGKRNSYNFTIPVMAVVRFNIAENTKWNVEVGPYVSFVLDSKVKRNRYLGVPQQSAGDPGATATETGADVELVDGTGAAIGPRYAEKAAPVDFGIKMGTSFTVMKHWYVGVHYMAGCVPAWKQESYQSISKKFGGVTKAWTFTVGYDF